MRASRSIVVMVAVLIATLPPLTTGQETLALANGLLQRDLNGYGDLQYAILDLQRAKSRGDLVAVCDLQRLTGLLFDDRGMPDQAMLLLTGSARTAETLGQPRRRLIALMEMSRIALREGRIDIVRSICTVALEVSSESA